jgi:hypothetical protein
VRIARSAGRSSVTSITSRLAASESDRTTGMRSSAARCHTARPCRATVNAMGGSTRASASAP